MPTRSQYASVTTGTPSDRKASPISNATATGNSGPSRTGAIGASKPDLTLHIATAAAHGKLRHQRQQAAGDEHTGQHIGGGTVERGLAARYMARRERLEPQHLQRAKLGQQMQRHQQRAAASQRRPSCGSRISQNVRHGPCPSDRAGSLVGGIDASQCRRHRQRARTDSARS